MPHKRKAFYASRASAYTKRPRIGGVTGAYARRPGAVARSFPGRARYNIRSGGLLGVELKYYDTSLSAASLSASSDATGAELDPSATILLNTIIQGDGPQNRDGRKVCMKSVMLRGVVKAGPQTNQTTTDGAASIMVALVLDKQTNGATINSEEVFTNKAAAAATNVHCFNNLENSGRYRVLKRLQMELPVQEPVYDGTNIEMQGVELPFQISHDFGKSGLMVNYTAGTTESVANITDNSLHVIGWTSSSATSPTVSYNARLRFVG